MIVEVYRINKERRERNLVLSTSFEKLKTYEQELRKQGPESRTE